ncbi:MAG: SDR family NAD(P)-dependent oxidoreductase [Lysobacterales bacterium]
MTIAQRSPIAIVGVSALFPGSSDATGFWRDILAGRDLLTDVPESHWRIADYYDPDPKAPDKTYARRGGFLDPVDFDALAWGLPPSTLPATDTSQLLALIVAQAVLQDAAGEAFEHMDRSRISVILGVTSAQELLFSMVSRLQRPVWAQALRDSGLDEAMVEAACARIADSYVPWQEASFPGLLGNVVAGRIANRLNLGGTNCVTDAACASSLSALSMAVSELQLGDSDLAIAGGVDTLNDIFMYMCFSKTPALSPSGDCRPFSVSADGTMLGEGLGMVALKRLADAERDGDRIYAVLRGIGTASDGRSKSVYAPVSAGQAQALRRAYEQAGYGPDSVELVEAHGTGTKAGDVAEFEGLRLCFAPEGGEQQAWCALGSVKSQIGHTKAAAGAAGLFKAVMALHHKVLPPTIKVDAPNPKLGIERSPFYLNTHSRPWIRGSAHPRRASVSAFGFGGSNFHATLEEYQGDSPALRLPVQPCELVLIAADSIAELQQGAVVLRDSNAPLAQIAADSRRRWRAQARHRLALVASSSAQLHTRLEAALKQMAARPEQAFALADGSSYGNGPVAGSTAFLFPGQGSQYLNMGDAVAMQFSAARAVWDRAADLPLDAQTALHQIVFPQPAFDSETGAAQLSRLTATEWTQPALAAHSAALLACLRELGIDAAAHGGHSFGELMALHAAGVLGLDQALSLARARGLAMRDAAGEPGAMIAISETLERVQALLNEHAPELVIANHNGPKQVVVSGTLAAVEKLQTVLAQQGMAGRRLPVASAFHSTLVAGASHAFAEALAGVDLTAASVPVYGNTHAAKYPSEAAEIRAQLAAQLAQPVRFVDMIEAMYARGIRQFVEVGPGAVLSGLVAAILGERPHRAIALDRKNRNGVESLLIGLAQLAAAGMGMQPQALFADTRLPPATAAPAKHAIAINGSNIGKPVRAGGAGVGVVASDGQGGEAKGSALRSGPTPTPAPAVVATPTAAPAPTSSPTLNRTAAMSAESSPSPDWLNAFQQMQQHTAEAHASFQRAMADSHSAYLRLAETAMAGLAAGTGSSAAPARVESVQATSKIAPAAAALGVAHSAGRLAEPALVENTPDRREDPAYVGGTEASAAESTAPAFDLAGLLLDIVADKTGYPVDMLNLDMDLEGDLGIDSIKRVEILAAVDERAPQLPKVDRAQLGAMATLAQIVAALESSAAPARVESVQATSTIAPAAAALGVAHSAGRFAEPALVESTPDRREDPAYAGGPSAATVAAENSVPTVGLAGLLLAIVADKTGYPVDMLNLDMDLEGDLGIDSIKRVEILAAVDERAPQLPKVDRAQLGAMATLRQIVTALESSAAPVRVELVQATSKIAPAAAAPGVAHSAGRFAEPALVENTPDRREDPAYQGAALGRYELQRVPAPASGLSMPGLFDGDTLSVIGHAEIAPLLVAELQARGVAARVDTALPSQARKCIYLGATRSVESVDAAIALNHEAFALARQLAPTLQSQPGLFVAVHGDLEAAGASADAAWAAGVPALIKTCALEWPQAACKSIAADLNTTLPQLARWIADELLGGGGEIEVALAATGERSSWISVPRPVQPDSPVIAAGDVVVVSGGARGVTAPCLIEWAGRASPRLVLLGRSALSPEPAICAGLHGESELKQALLSAAQAAGERLTPAELQARVRQVLSTREIRATLAELAAVGCEAHYLRASVEDAAEVDAALRRVRSEIGPIRGLIHAAGVIADKRIADKTDAQFAQVFATKVGGLRHLLAATRDDELKLLVAFSSVSARCGNTGQADYAMANEVLSKVLAAEQRRKPALRVKSLGWGPWQGGMVNPALAARFAELGVPMIPLDLGARLFADEMADAGALELVLGGEPRPQALLVDGAQSRIEALELRIDQDSHGWLEGHQVAGLPVVPLALVAEWMARAVRGWRPGLPLRALHELKVLKGIRLSGFRNGGDCMRIEARSRAGDPQLELRILGKNGVLHYSARAEFGRPEISAEARPTMQLEAWNGTPMYQDLLFHRGRFELIESLTGISDEGVAARLRGVAAAAWPDQDWHFDVAALDGGLQLAVLYGQRMLGGPNLPTSVAELRHLATPVPGPITAAAYARRVGQGMTTTDIVYTDASGRAVAEMLGVQNHAIAP